MLFKVDFEKAYDFVDAKGLHVMMDAMVENNIFYGYQVGKNDPVIISHLQFDDVTLILGKKSSANV